MPSDTLSSRQKSVAEVLSIVREQSEAVAAGLDAFFAPDVREGEAPPDFARLQEIAGRAFERLLGDLIEADDELFAARTEAGRLRVRFREAFSDYRHKVVRLRDGIRQFYPRGDARSLTKGDTPRAPEKVFALAGHIVAWIDRPDVEDDDLFAVKNKRDQMARELKDNRRLLERSTAATTAHRLARQRRKECFEAFNEGFVYLAGLLENLYGLSGHPEWSRLVRASRQEKGLLMSVMKRRRAARAAARAARGGDDDPAGSPDGQSRG